MRILVAIVALVMPAFVLAAGAEKYNVSVDGMTCGACASKVKESLAKIPGAEKVEIVLKKKTATFSIKENRPELQAEITKAVADAGFTVTAINGKKVDAAAAQPTTESKAN